MRTTYEFRETFHPYPPRRSPIGRLARALYRIYLRSRRSWLQHDWVCVLCGGLYWPHTPRHGVYHADCKHYLDWHWRAATGSAVPCWECPE